MSTKSTLTDKPFGVTWLDSCYQQTMLPNGPWHDMMIVKLCDVIAPKLQKQFDVDERRQIISELTGQEFMHKYYPQIIFTPHILEPPCMHREERLKLEVDAENWLQHVVTKSAAELNCQRLNNTQDNSTVPCAEMTEFNDHTKHLFQVGLNRHLYVLERHVSRAVETAQCQAVKLRADRDKLATSLSQTHRSNTQTKQSIPHSQSHTARTHLSTARSQLSTPRTQEYTSSAPLAPCWGHRSNRLGKSVVAILRRDPRRFTQVTASLHGRQLCSTLRTYIWLEGLMITERNKLNHVNLESMLRERFAKCVSRGTTELNIKRATHSPISNVIDNTIVEIYNSTAGMRLYIDKELHMTETAKTLNILYVYDRTYEPYLVYWLFPLQLAFQQGSGEPEHCYELALFLDLLNKDVDEPVAGPLIQAERVMLRLNAADPSLHQHLQTIAHKHTKLNTKEFLVQLIHREKTQADLILSAGTGSPAAGTKATGHRHSAGSKATEPGSMSRDLLADPVIFLRKWIGEAFVGILDTPAVVYIWDQCFMQRWKTSVIEDFCLALLLLLRDKFIAATDYMSMRQIFLYEPCKLFTIDIQRSWVHIQNKGSLSQVTEMNQLITVSSRAVSQQQQQQQQQQRDSVAASVNGSVLSVTDVINVGPFVINDINIDLTLTQQFLDERQLSTNNVQLTCLVYYGESLVESQTSQVDVVDIKYLNESRQLCRLTFRDKTFNAVFLFTNIDLTEYDIEQATGGYPRAVLQLMCRNSTDLAVTSDNPTTTSNSDIALGWVDIPLYERVVGSSEWQILAGQKSVTLTPGLYGHEGHTAHIYIGPKCQLQCTVSRPTV